MLCGVVAVMAFGELRFRDAAWVALRWVSYLEVLAALLAAGGGYVASRGRAWRRGEPASLLPEAVRRGSTIGDDSGGDAAAAASAGRGPRCCGSRGVCSAVAGCCGLRSLAMCVCRCCVRTPGRILSLFGHVMVLAAGATALSCFVLVFAMVTTFSSDLYWHTVLLSAALVVDTVFLAFTRAASLRWRPLAACDVEDMMRYGVRMKRAWHAGAAAAVLAATLLAHLAVVLDSGATVVLGVSWTLVFLAIA